MNPSSSVNKSHRLQFQCSRINVHEFSRIKILLALLTLFCLPACAEDKCHHEEMLARSSRRLGRFVRLGIAGEAIVRGDELPFAGDFHPDVGQAIAIVVGFTVEHAAFVIGRDHHRGVFVDVNLNVG